MGDVKTLRQRIRPIGINCTPWRYFRGELDYLPISAKTLFKKGGLGIDVWEMNLKSEGYLLPNENLLEVLKIESNLYRRTIDLMTEEDNFGLIPDDWEEEDFEQLNISEFAL